MPSKIIPSDHKQKMIDAYERGASMTEAAAQFGYSQTACRNVLQAAGIDRRSASLARREYELNEAFFDDLSDPLAAYWFGMLCSDGTIGKGTNTVSLSLKESDRGHLEAFAHDLGSGKPLVWTGSTYRLDSTSKKMATTLRGYGLGVLKHDRERLDVRVPESVRWHFWRGVFDGDGGISRHKKGWYMVSLTGPDTLVEPFAALVRATARYEKLGSLASVGRISRRFTVTGTYVCSWVLGLTHDIDGPRLERKQKLREEIAVTAVKTRAWLPYGGSIGE